MTEEKTTICFLDEKTGKPLGSVELSSKLVKELKQKDKERNMNISAAFTEAIEDFLKEAKQQ